MKKMARKEGKDKDDKFPSDDELNKFLHETGLPPEFILLVRQFQEMFGDLLGVDLTGQKRSMRGEKIFGFSFSISPDGKPVIREIKPSTGFTHSPKSTSRRSVPVDVLDRDSTLEIIADVGSSSIEDLDIVTEGNRLLIISKSKGPLAEVSLPSRVNKEPQNIELRNGVLTIRLKKKKFL